MTKPPECEFSYQLPDSDASVFLTFDPNPAELNNICFTVSKGEEQVTIRLRKGAALQLGRAFVIFGEGS